MSRKQGRETYLVLHNIRSVHNAGSIFRTAEAAGVANIYLSGYTPGPLDRFGRERKDFAKAALGAEKHLVWERVEEVETLLAKLKAAECFIVALEQSPRSVDYKKLELPAKAVLILGNETEGVPESILKRCDVIAEIPMAGKKESLNVSVAAGIALFRMLGR